MNSNNNKNVATLVIQLTSAATALVVAAGLVLLGTQLFPELLKKDW